MRLSHPRHSSVSCALRYLEFTHYHQLPTTLPLPPTPPPPLAWRLWASCSQIKSSVLQSTSVKEGFLLERQVLFDVARKVYLLKLWLFSEEDGSHSELVLLCWNPIDLDLQAGGAGRFPYSKRRMTWDFWGNPRGDERGRGGQQDDVSYPGPLVWSLNPQFLLDSPTSEERILHPGAWGGKRDNVCI